MLAHRPATESSTTFAPVARSRSPPTAANDVSGRIVRSAVTSRDAWRSPDASPAHKKTSAGIAGLRLVEAVDRRARVTVARASSPCGRTRHDASVRRLHEEIHQLAPFGCGQRRAQLFENRRAAVFRAIQLAVRFLQFVDGLPGDAAALHAFDVESAHESRITLDH